MKFISKLKIPKKILAIGVIAAAVVLLIPVLRLAFYATPFYDDYNYAYFVRAMLEQKNSFFSVIKGAYNAIAYSWYTWQGTYSSIFFMALMPATWGDDLYFIGIWAIVLMMMAGAFVLAYTIFTKVLKSDKADGVIAGGFLAIVLMETIYSAQQCIYWYNGSLHYTFMHGVMMLYISMVIRLLCAEKKSSKIVLMILSMILAFLSAGANFITTLQGFIISASIIAVALLLKNKNWRFQIPSILVYLVGMGINILAPGNDHRQAYYVSVSLSPVKSVLMSFVSGVKRFPEFTGFMMIAIMILFTPLFLEMLPKVNFKYRFPGLVSLYSFGVYCTGFTPSYFGMGYDGLARMFGAMKMTLIILILVNQFYWMGWIRNKLIGKKKDFKNPGHNVLVYALVCVIIFVTTITAKAQVDEFLTYGTYYYIHTGEAANYKADFKQRVAILENVPDEQRNEIIDVPPLVWRPWFLYKLGELSGNWQDEQNVALAGWYRVAGVRVPGEEFTGTAE